MGLMATARGRIRKRIVEVVTAAAGLASRLRLSWTAERPGLFPSSFWPFT